MKNPKLKLYLFLGLIFAFIIPGVLAQSTSASSQNSEQNWLLVIQSIGATGVVISTVIELISAFTKKFSFFSTKPNNITEDLKTISGFWYSDFSDQPSAEDMQEIRTQLTIQLTKDVQQRLKNNLCYLIQLDLAIGNQTHYIDRDLSSWEMKDFLFFGTIDRCLQSFHDSRSPVQLLPSQHIIDILGHPDIQGKLWIIAEPGGGKTTELLTLAQDLLVRSKAQKQPIPLLFELSTWNDCPLDCWLIGQIQGKYHIKSQLVAKALLDENLIIPLLDGLDELELAQQQKCIQAIQYFIKQRPKSSLVICYYQRKHEPHQAELDKLNGAIYLHPLSPENVKRLLDLWRHHDLLEAIQHQSELLEIAQNPLFLSMLLSCYTGENVRTVKELLSIYIRAKLHDTKNQSVFLWWKPPEPKKTLRYLRWLAQKLEERKCPEFRIEKLQPDWLDSSKQRWSHKIITGLMGGIIYGIIGGLIGGILGSLMPGLKNEVRTLESIDFPWERFLKILPRKSPLRQKLMSKLIFRRSNFSKEEHPNHNLKMSFKISLVRGLIFGLIFGLTGGIILGPTIIVPLVIMLMPDVLFEPIDIIIAGLVFGLIIGLMFGLVLGLTIGIIMGLIPVLQHVSLRLVLYIVGVAPWNYARFLDHAVRHRFIQRLGGRYRFVHDLLRKHFAALTDEDIAELAKPL